MKKTQRLRFREQDVSEGIIWATPLGRVTFAEHKYGILTTVGNSRYLFSTERRAMQGVNRLIREKRTADSGAKI